MNNLTPAAAPDRSRGASTLRPLSTNDTPTDDPTTTSADATPAAPAPTRNYARAATHSPPADAGEGATNEDAISAANDAAPTGARAGLPQRLATLQAALDAIHEQIDNMLVDLDLDAEEVDVRVDHLESRAAQLERRIEDYRHMMARAGEPTAARRGPPTAELASPATTTRRTPAPLMLGTSASDARRALSFGSGLSNIAPTRSAAMPGDSLNSSSLTPSQHDTFVALDQEIADDGRMHNIGTTRTPSKLPASVPRYSEPSNPTTFIASFQRSMLRNGYAVRDLIRLLPEVLPTHMATHFGSLTSAAFAALDATPSREDLEPWRQIRLGFIRYVAGAGAAMIATRELDAVAHEPGTPLETFARTYCAMQDDIDGQVLETRGQLAHAVLTSIIVRVSDPGAREALQRAIIHLVQTLDLDTMTSRDALLAACQRADAEMHAMRSFEAVAPQPKARRRSASAERPRASQPGEIQARSEYGRRPQQPTRELPPQRRSPQPAPPRHGGDDGWTTVRRTNDARPRPDRHLSEDERRRRLEQQLCFACGSPSHKAANCDAATVGAIRAPDIAPAFLVEQQSALASKAAEKREPTAMTVADHKAPPENPSIFGGSKIESSEALIDEQSWPALGAPAPAAASDAQ